MGTGQNVSSALILRLGKGGSHHGLLSMFILRHDTVSIFNGGEVEIHALLPPGAVQGNPHGGAPSTAGTARVSWVVPAKACLSKRPPASRSAGSALCGGSTVPSCGL